jgi:hypothetical protein
MKLADRSVGHIDYAIRRRFAFCRRIAKRFTEEEELLLILFYLVKLFSSV